eukprot:GHVU01128705.1.p1 GENE.GHVU01128705.1~~GHVU01128705.1.p1  ORF type:complete len:228 (+),score=34.22 GHVU01128705.1:496-1179(+)
MCCCCCRRLSFIASSASAAACCRQDVCWRPDEAHTLATVGDDGIIRLWDTRKPTPITGPADQMSNTSVALSCVAANPHHPYMLAAGGNDKNVTLWDARAPGSPLHVIAAHKEQITRIKFHPHRSSLLASSGGDRRVNVWDLSKIGMEQSPEDAEDGPPELVIGHSGHLASIQDFDWNPEPEQQWNVVSVSEDNRLQVWQLSESWMDNGDNAVSDDGDDESIRSSDVE